MKKKWKDRIFKARICDNCGRINPKRLYGNDRLCGEEPCVHTDGFYKKPGTALGTDGKVGFYRIQWPVSIRWKGWWTL